MDPRIRFKGWQNHPGMKMHLQKMEKMIREGYTEYKGEKLREYLERHGIEFEDEEIPQYLQNCALELERNIIQIANDKADDKALLFAMRDMARALRWDTNRFPEETPEEFEAFTKANTPPPPPPVPWYKKVLPIAGKCALLVGGVFVATALMASTAAMSDKNSTD